MSRWWLNWESLGALGWSARDQQRYIDGTPWSLLTLFYLMDLAQSWCRPAHRGGRHPPGDPEQPARSQLAFGRRATVACTTTVRAPDLNEAAFFRLPNDGRISVIEQRRTAYADDGEAGPADGQRLPCGPGSVSISSSGRFPLAT